MFNLIIFAQGFPFGSGLIILLFASSSLGASFFECAADCPAVLLPHDETYF